jgi:hypothetical protein
MQPASIPALTACASCCVGAAAAPQLAKLLCASAGQREFSMASWDRAVQLERMRKARVAALQPQAPPPPQHGGATAQQAAQQVA